MLAVPTWESVPVPEHRGAEFTVDTGLFRQLGELLVGRDSTALAELIKNAYDADATEVVLTGHNLSDASRAEFVIADNGVGMTVDQLRGGFLRVAASGKAHGDRRSPVYRRRYTGEKGVGRLAAHKLASLVEVTSVALVNELGHPAAAEVEDLREVTTGSLQRRRTLTQARIDWDEIERFGTLAEVTRGLEVSSGPAPNHAAIGTRLRLSRLRHAWTAREVSDLVRQLQNFEPPSDLVGRLPRGVVPRPVLFEQPVIRDAERRDPGMHVAFEGEVDTGDNYWGSLLRTAEWVLEIRAERGHPVKYALSPTSKQHEENPYARAVTAECPHPSPASGPFFDARILLRTGKPPTSEEAWSATNSGIRIFLEGFRVLPYGEPRNDWLSLDADYTRRSGRLELDPLLTSRDSDLAGIRTLGSRDISLRLFSNRAFFGAVFLTDEGTGGLRTLVNREGFVPDAHYERLVGLVQLGVRLLLRSRAHAQVTQKRAQQQERSTFDVGSSEWTSPATSTSGLSVSPSSEAANKHSEGFDQPSTEDAWELFTDDVRREGAAARLSRALSTLEQAVSAAQEDANGSPEAAARAALVKLVEDVRTAADNLIEDASLLRVLASVGTQLAAFTHELGHLVPTAALAERALEPSAPGSVASRLANARSAVENLRRALERQSAYLVDVGSNEARRRRSRQPLRERVEATFLAFAGSAAALNVKLDDEVPANLKTPPMFRAEVHAILTNLVSNAIKAAGTNGRVAVTATRGISRLPNGDGQGVTLRVHNTGIAVTPEDAERWFTPYQSTSISVDPALGQGMGLGLPITRDLVAEYGGSIRFIPAEPGFATSVEVVIPE